MSDALKKYPPVIAKTRFTVCRSILREFKKNSFLYFMCFPGILFFFLLNYIPMGGIVVAFKEFIPREGLWGSPWIGTTNFDYLVKNQNIMRVIKNTLTLNIVFIVSGVIVSVVLALMLNEVKCSGFRKFSQSILILPHFVSFMVVSLLVYALFSTRTGVVNNTLIILGIAPFPWYGNAKPWPFILLGVSLWKGAGWGSIIYLATLAGINPELYEAVDIDGGNKLQKIRYISLPHLKHIVTVLMLLAIGGVLNSDFGLFYGIIGDNALLLPTTDVLDTFVYRSLRIMGDIGMSSAAGFSKSIIGFFLVLFANLMARRYSSDGALF